MKFICRSFVIIFTLLYRSIRDILGSTSYFMTVAIIFLHATARSAALLPVLPCFHTIQQHQPYLLQPHQRLSHK